MTVEPSPVAVDAPEPIDEAKLAELERYILESRDLAKIPGLSVAVVQNGEVIYLKGFGVRDLKEKKPVSPDTLFVIASTTKPLTTMMMATVVDDGQMGWDALVTSILPSFTVGDPDLTRNLTMRHLVCACSGMPAEDSALFLSDMNNAQDLLKSMRLMYPVSEFEKEFNYSNQMVAAGGYIAAHAANGSMEDLGRAYISSMQERIFDPVGMASTTFSTQKVLESNNYAIPHGVDLENNFQSLDLSAEKFVASILPAGGAWSNANDMARLLVTALNQGISPDGERVVSAQNFSKTWDPQVEIEEGRVAYGLGWIIEEYHGMQLVHHSGNSMGFSADLALLPSAGLGIVILTNAEGAGDFVHAIRYRLFELAFGYPHLFDSVFQRDLEAGRKRITDFAGNLQTEVDAQAISPYLATFGNDKLGEISLNLDNGKLILITGGLTSEIRQLSVPGKTIFVLSDVPWAVLGQWTLQLETDADGNPTITLLEKGVNQPFIFLKSNGS